MPLPGLTLPVADDPRNRAFLRQLADQAFTRASGTPLRAGNSVQLLQDASENYPAWLEAIAAARHTIHLEMYIFADDAVGRQFAEALIERAQTGVRVRVLYDWMGGLGKSSHHLWRMLRDAGVEVRCYNPPRLDSPLGWLSRDHRKVLCVDGEVAFVTGLCIAKDWVGAPEHGVAAWRDTGIALRGPAVVDVEIAFADAWATCGPPMTHEAIWGGSPATALHPVGEISVRVVATVPNTGGLYRVDQLVAALAQERLWLTDAYFSPTSVLIQALRAASADGVDVRILVPGASDLPWLQPFSRAGYRPLLEAGVRIFEWNGSMLHAKTAVADGRWARVGSTNLNLASWVGNRELDVIVEDVAFATKMEAQYQEDLANSTEVVLDLRRRVRSTGPKRPRRRDVPHGGSGKRVVASAARLGESVTAAITQRRVLEPQEARISFAAAATLALFAFLAIRFPHAVAYPAALLAVWVAISFVSRGVSLIAERRRKRKLAGGPTPVKDPPQASDGDPRK